VRDQADWKLQDSSRRDSLTGSQSPFAIILGCADSRVIPELAFDTGLGELFVVRVAANVANSSSIASIEYAVAHLDVQLIVVLGHQSCGAVMAAVDGGDNGYNLNHFLTHISPAIAASKKDTTINDIVKKNAENSVEELKNRSMILIDAMTKGDLKIIPAYYELSTGEVNFI
jgi:carbonic anhydrase